jgi:hypothetical protein
MFSGTEQRPRLCLCSNGLSGENEMKEPRIKHHYDRRKDKMKIVIRGYSLSKITRGEIIENVVSQIERSPDTLIAHARKSNSKLDKKSARGQPKVSRLEEVGD